MPAPRNAREEATAVLSDGFEARVLEPSPPAVTDAPHFADDPVDPEGATGTVVSPVEGLGARRWTEVAADDPLVAEFAAERWLGPWKALAELPDGFAETRDALHRLALHVVYRVRRRANGKYGLRWTLGGFGTPFFGDDEQVRVSGATLLHQTPAGLRVEPVTSLAAAAATVGLDLDPDFDHGFHDVVAAGDVDADLGVDARASLALGDWFGLATAALEQVRADETRASPSRVQLWPEHFDLAVDVGFGGGDGQRVNLGASPGDGFHAEPYVYVGPWTDDRPGDPSFWNAPFGAVLGHAEIRAAGDGAAQRERVLDHLRRGLTLLRTG